MPSSTVNKALTRVRGVREVAVSLKKKEAVVRFEDTETNVARIRIATQEAGYPSTVKKPATGK